MGEHSGKFLRVVGVQTEGEIDLFSTVVTGSVLRNLNNCVWLLMYFLCFQERSQFSNQHEDVSVPSSSWCKTAECAFAGGSFCHMEAAHFLRSNGTRGSFHAKHPCWSGQ